jgi:hypothetical protein
MKRLLIKNIILKYQKELQDTQGYVLSVWDVLSKQDQKYLLKKGYIKEMIQQEPDFFDVLRYIEKKVWKKFDDVMVAKDILLDSVMSNVYLNSNLDFISTDLEGQRTLVQQMVDSFEKSSVVKDYIFLMNADIEDELEQQFQFEGLK